MKDTERGLFVAISKLIAGVVIKANTPPGNPNDYHPIGDLSFIEEGKKPTAEESKVENK